MRILHIAAGLPPGGGISESVPTLCRYLRQRGHEVTLATLDGPLSGAALSAEAAGVRLVRFAPSWPHALYFSWRMLRGLPALAREADAVHVHSNWTFPVWWGCRCALKAGKPLVMSPRGTLNPVYLKHSAWKKGLVGWLDRSCLRQASVIHATAECERDWIQEYLFRRGAKAQGNLNVTVVPNGITLEPRNTRNTRNREKGEARTLLYLGRLHPLKGLDLLTAAWRQVVAGHPQWKLLIVGPDEQGVRQRLEQQVRELRLEQRVSFGRPVYGEEKKRLFADADLFVLPTRSESFGMAVAEALACGVPVITTKGAPWAELLGAKACLAGWQDSGVAEWQDSGVAEWQDSGGVARAESTPIVSRAIPANPATSAMPAASATPATLAIPATPANPAIAANGRCGWWVDIGVEPLAEALREAMGLTDEERRIMGENGRQLVERKYRWEAVAERMAEVYSRIAE